MTYDYGQPYITRDINAIKIQIKNIVKNNKNIKKII